MSEEQLESIGSKDRGDIGMRYNNEKFRSLIRVVERKICEIDGKLNVCMRWLHKSL